MRRFLRGLCFFLRTGHRDPLSLMDSWFDKRVGTEKRPLTEQDIQDALKELD